MHYAMMIFEARFADFDWYVSLLEHQLSQDLAAHKKCMQRRNDDVLHEDVLPNAFPGGISGPPYLSLFNFNLPA